MTQLDLQLCDASIDGQSFERIHLEGSAAAPIDWRNVRLHRCSVQHQLVVFSGVGVLDDVEMSDLACTCCEIEAHLVGRVRFTGRATRELEVIPGAGRAEGPGPPQVSLDLEGFEGEVKVFGLAHQSVRIAPRRHAIILGSELDSTAWNDERLIGFRFWRLLARLVRRRGVDCGVFSLPLKQNPSLHAQAMLLAELGLIIFRTE